MAMSELKQKLLLNELAKAEFANAVYEPQNDVIRIQTDNEGRSILINDDYEVRFLQANRETALFTVKPLVDKLSEIISAWENASTVPFENLTHYRILAEYNSVIMAARDDTEYGRGLYFVTWRYNYDRTGVENGYYTEDYNDVKENFAQRSELVPKEKLFTQEQAAEIKTVIENLFENDYDLYLSYEKTEMLNSIIEQINDAYPGIESHNKQEWDEEIITDTLSETVMNISDKPVITAKTINGDVQSDDWVIAAGNRDLILTKYPLIKETDTTVDDKLLEIEKPSEKSEQTAAKPKTLAEKLQAANEKVKVQDSQNNDKKSHKREERD